MDLPTFLSDPQRAAVSWYGRNPKPGSSALLFFVFIHEENEDFGCVPETLTFKRHEYHEFDRFEELGYSGQTLCGGEGRRGRNQEKKEEEREEEQEEKEGIEGRRKEEEEEGEKEEEEEMKSLNKDLRMGTPFQTPGICELS